MPTPNPLKHKTLALASFKASATEEGVAEMIVNVFDNVDSYNERSKPGCFSKSIARKAPKGVWMHDWQRPVAKTLEAIELLPGDARLPDSIKNLGGLYIKGAFNLGVQDGREAYEHLKFGSIDEFSIGYYEVKTSMAKDGIEDLLELDLIEWSPVLLGANPATSLIDVKSASASAALAPPKVKSQYLGTYAEASACFAAIDDLWYRFCWYALQDALYDDPEEGESIETTLQDLELAFTEFQTLSMNLIRTIMGGDGSEGAKRAAIAEIQARIPNPETLPEAPPASASFNAQIQAALAAVEGCITRGQAISALRAKDARSLSPQRREKLLTLKQSLDTLLKDATPRATEGTRLAIEADFLRIQAQHRQALR